MQFFMRKNGIEYLDVVLKVDGVQIEFGLLDKQERRSLAAVLLEAADDLTRGLDKDASDA